MPDILSVIEEDSRSALSETSRLGALGEQLAARFLESEGCRIVMANFTAPIGRNNRGAQIKGEIDIVALDGETICFVEVKTRRTSDFASPIANVDIHKQRVITRTARVYRRIFAVGAMNYRFDVVSVVGPDEPLPAIEIFRAFWKESRFKKKAWLDEPYQNWYRNR